MRNRLVTTLSLTALTGAVAFSAAGIVRAQGGDTPAATTTPAATAPATPGITVNGSVEAYYTYNSNRPSTNTNSFIFNNREGQFGLNLIDLRFSKAATPTSRTGFLIRLIDGDAQKIIIVPGDTDNVLEAYGTLLLPLSGRDVKVDVGQFVTHIGYETIELGTNNQFSRSLLFQIPAPFYNAGVRAAFPVNASTTFTGYILNRYNGLNDPGNRDIAPGFQILHNFAGGSSFILNGLTSRENLGQVLDAAGNVISRTNNKQQSILDLILVGQVSPRTKLALEALYRFGKDAVNTSYNSTGVAGYGSFTMANGNVLGLRGEYYKQSKVTTGLGFPEYAAGPGLGQKVKLSEITASYELHSAILPNVRTLLEYRYDRADKPFFPGSGSNIKKDQSTFTVGEAYTF